LEIAAMTVDFFRRCTFVGILLALLAIGCSAKEEFAEVTGVVLLDGKPMPAALVEFLPDPEQGTHGPVSAATTDDEGRFRLVSHDRRPGATIGKHRVLVQDARSIPQAVTDFSKVKAPPVQPSRIPSTYGSAASTPLRKEVKPGPQTINVEVTSKGLK